MTTDQGHPPIAGAPGTTGPASAGAPVGQPAPVAPPIQGEGTIRRAPTRRQGAAAELAETMVPALPGTRRRDLYRAILTTVAELAEDDTDDLDLKLTSAALAEMAEAFRMFSPYRGLPKVTFFGSARTKPDDPLYLQAQQLAARLAHHGWMVITGAGPGIMAAAMEGAGREQSLGVNIRLPFEQGANPFIAQDPKLVEMRYFFTRKLMLIKESDAYAVLPGGFGTLDEAFELLTLLQTGKAQPAPLVLLDVPDGTYWRGWRRFLDEQVAAHGLVDPDDQSLYRITADVDHAADEILHFYRNYHSLRWVGDLLVLRLRFLPDAGELTDINRRFADILVGGKIRPTKALAPERTGHDFESLPRLALRFDRTHFGRLRQLIDALNAVTGPDR